MQGLFSWKRRVRDHKTFHFKEDMAYPQSTYVGLAWLSAVTSNKLFVPKVSWTKSTFQMKVKKSGACLFECGCGTSLSPLNPPTPCHTVSLGPCSFSFTKLGFVHFDIWFGHVDIEAPCYTVSQGHAHSLLCLHWNKQPPKIFIYIWQTLATRIGIWDKLKYRTLLLYSYLG